MGAGSGGVAGERLSQPAQPPPDHQRCQPAEKLAGDLLGDRETEKLDDRRELRFDAECGRGIHVVS